MNDDNMMAQLRKEKGLSQRELAKECDLAPSYISELESKTKDNPSIPTINKLENVLGKKIRDFFLN